MITYSQSDKSNVAWFKLAEFVARREKERALGIYRLLVHSIQDEGLAIQLEGDLLLAFNDERAVQCYQRAAEIYEREGKFVHAIGLYEHCILLKAISLPLLYSLITLYEHTGQQNKMVRLVALLVKSLLAQADYEQAATVFERYTSSHEDHDFFSSSFLNELITHYQCETHLMHLFVQALVKRHKEGKGLSSLATVLSALNALAPTVYADALQLLSQTV